MSNYAGEDFEHYQDHTTYFLREDSLSPLTFDLYFTPLYKYTCKAGCHVCYIKDKLKEGFASFPQNVPDKITSADEQRWFDTFQYFYTVRTNDDMTFLRLNYPHIFQWYKEHGKMFEYGMTDNAVLKHRKTLLDHIDMKAMADISFSEDFLVKTNKRKEILEVLKDLSQKYEICKIKIIRTTDGTTPYQVEHMVDWMNEQGLDNCIQHDLRNDANYRFELDGKYDYQNTYILSHNNKTYQIYREAIHLYNDRFFYSIDDATDINWDPFFTWQPEQAFDPEELMYEMLVGKQKLYGKFSNEIQPVTQTDQKFVDYFTEVQKFKFNRQFNFIPEFMLRSNCKYYSMLQTKGFKHTPYGLVRPEGKTTPIIHWDK